MAARPIWAKLSVDRPMKLGSWAVRTAHRVNLTIAIMGSVPIHCDAACLMLSRLLRRGVEAKATTTTVAKLRNEVVVDVDGGRGRRYDRVKGTRTCRHGDSDVYPQEAWGLVSRVPKGHGGTGRRTI